MSGKNSSNSNGEDSQIKQKRKRKIIRKKYRDPKMNIQQQINDLDYSWDEKDNFIVERIIGQQTWDGQKYYLIKWQGFDITMSTWEQASKMKHLPELITEYQKSCKGKKTRAIKESSDKMMNPYRATETHGHFLYGDQPSEIVNTFVEFDSEGRKTIFLQVAWKHRDSPEGKVCLENSILQSDLIFEHDPQFLLNFYEKSVVLKTPSI